jgi:hypothetical protein
MRLDLEPPIAVICHDAGATNHILSWLKVDGRLGAVRAVMRGPAECLWQHAFPEVPLCYSIEMALEGARSVISGTGWASNIEHDARRMAKERGIPSVAILDHWVNYAERFIREGKLVWPDEFWVVDDHAMAIAEKTFPGTRIRLVPNLYLASQVQSVKPAPIFKPELLYLLEPMRSDWGRGEDGEFQALDYFVTKLPLLNLPLGIAIRLRSHPSEPSGKYDAWIAMNPALHILTDESTQMSDALSRARWVAGCESFALVIALAAGRQVFCTLPPWAPACRLPHDGLIHLNKLAVDELL